MVKLDKKTWKQNYFTKLVGLLEKYSKVLVVGVDNVQSKQMQIVRMQLRGKAELLMGKNTMIRRCFRDNAEQFPHLEALLPNIVGNIGFCFTDMDLAECRDLLESNKIQAQAKVGVIAPVDVIIPAGITTMGPEKTSFFQALNLSTKITKGNIEIMTDTTVCVKGARVGISESKLLNMLNISPFYYGLVCLMIVDGDSVYPPAVLDVSTADIIQKFRAGANNVAALSLGLSIPNAASAPHMIMNAFKNILAIAVVTDYTFLEAEKVKAYLENPDAFAAANNTPAAGGGDDKKEEAKAPVAAEESEEEEDMEFGLFD